ncbi:UTRA domain-containing protein [Nocardia aurea]|uniref:UTRA domain-containing protein n=1 Tax=Nocardia aurea TaxID=2144174 RepID=A0ABV3G0C2_9NOCA
MFRATGNGYRATETVEVITSAVTESDSIVTKALSLPEGAPVIARRRVYRDHTGVVIVSTSWLPGDFTESAGTVRGAWLWSLS